MWHVDQGTLHAFLDDRERGPAAGALDAETRARVTAHVTTCDVCAAELRRAERERTRAAGILGEAAPAIEAPPFEAVQPRAAERVPAAVRRPRAAWVPLAWAASLVLAVGAGWIGSMLWLGGGAAREASRPPAEAATAATAPTAAAPGAADSNLAAASQAAPPASRAASGASPATEPRLASRETAANVGGAGEAPGVPATVVAAETAAGAVRAELEQLAVADAPARREPAAAPPGGVAKARERAEDVVRARAAAAPPVAPSPRSFLPTQAAQDAVAEVAAGYPGDADVAWETVSRAAAERLLGGPVYLLAGAPVEELAAAVGAQPVPLVRVRQRAGDGVVELLQWRSTAQPQELRAMAEALPMAAPQGVVAPPAVQPGRTRDGGRFAAVPGTLHPVLLRTPAAVDPLPLLPRVQAGRQ